MDEFSNIKSLNNEISQTTYVELISVTPSRSKAFNGAKPSVENAWPLLLQNKRYPYNIKATEQQETLINKSKYNYSKNPDSGLDYSSAITSYTFRELIANPYAEGDSCNFLALKCLDGSGNEIISDCKLDVMFMLDVTGSMGRAIKNVKTNVLKMVNIIETITKGDYRLGIVTYRDCPDIKGVLPFPDEATGCANKEKFIAALDPLRATLGSNEPESADIAIQSALNGEFGNFRQDPQVIKIIVWITDARTAGCNDAYDPEDVANLYAAADRAATCGVKFMCVAIPGSKGYIVDEVRNDMSEVAKRTDGLYVETVADASDLISLVTTYLEGICAQEAQQNACAGEKNLIINGRFDVDIAAWTILNNNVTHDSTKKMMKLKKVNSNNARASQTINNLNPGDIIYLNLDMYPGSIDGTLNYQFTHDGPENVSYIANGPKKTLSLQSVVPLNGSVTVEFDSNECYIDNVSVCVFKNNTCGPGISNLLQNGDFEEQLDYWKDEFNNNITVSSETYDSESKSAIVDKGNNGQIRQTLSDLIIGKDYTIELTILSNEPNDIESLALDIGVLEANAPFNQIASKTITNKEITKFPYTTSLLFKATQTSHVIFVKSGNISGIAKIKNVNVCQITCDYGYVAVYYSDFDTVAGIASRSGWSGGTASSEGLLIAANTSVTQSFEIKGNSLINFAFMLKNNGGAIIDILYDDRDEQFLTKTIAGVDHVNLFIPGDGSGTTITIKITARSSDILIDDMLLCENINVKCDGSLSGTLVATIKWNGIPRKPVNLFNVFLRATIRDPNDPFSKKTVNILPIAESHLSGTTCDFWNQNGNGNSKESLVLAKTLTSNIMSAAVVGNVVDVSSRVNWIWSIPYEFDQPSSIQDLLTINFELGSLEGIVESIELFYLSNIIYPETDATPPIKPAVIDSPCDPDPSAEINISIAYDDNLTRHRDHNMDIDIHTLYPQQVDYELNSPKTWDTLLELGTGLKGRTAKWESAKFVLDSTTGGGLNQCSAPTAALDSGAGVLEFPTLSLSGTGIFINKCTPEVTIEDISTGRISNELQSIILSSPTAGKWDLTITIDDSADTLTLPWNITYIGLRNQIANLPSVGIGNVDVSGSGTNVDPFLVTFQGALAGKDIPLMVADGGSLVGSSPGVVNTVRNGTKNEVQTITPRYGTHDFLIVEFNGETSIPIAYNASINEKQSALEGIPTIGAGNISVTGLTTDRDSDYTEELMCEFIGDLAATNVPQMIVSPTSQYSIITNWNGGSGTSEIQQIRVIANGGYFTLTIADPDSNGTYTTVNIPFNATTLQVRNAIAGATFIDVIDLKVEALAPEPSPGDLEFHGWSVTFKGKFVGVDIDQMTIDSSKLKGGGVIVKEIIKGGSISDQQRLIIKNANSGFFRLKIKVHNVAEWTDKIVHDTTAANMQIIIEDHSEIEPGQVSILEEYITEPYTRSFLMVFMNVGDVPIIEANYINSLKCQTFKYGEVPPPPYKYEAIAPEEIGDDYSCQSGPLFSGANPIENGDEPSLCCNYLNIKESANVSSRYIIQRDLFDPTSKPSGSILTVRQLALVKGLNPDEYNSYIRDFNTNVFKSVNYESYIKTGMSVILINKDIDSPAYQSRYAEHFKSHREILPTRMVWPSGLLPAQG